MLGAGFQGTCTALELARRGAVVDLFDRHDRPLEGPGGFNEGKIHLGFVYANDSSRATAELMLRGALSFWRLLGRWVDLGGAGGPSEPFVYAVHRDSLLTAARVREHVSSIGERLRLLLARGDGDYLGGSPTETWRELAPDELRVLFDPGLVVAAFATCERSVDPPRIAALLREVVAASGEVRFVSGTAVEGVREEEGRLSVRASRGGESLERRYDHVVNALWDGRLAVDATAGVRPSRPWLHRCKYGIRLVDDAGRQAGPSTTVVLGPFGDVVRFSDGRSYLSWYPACRTAASAALEPPRWPSVPPPAEADAMVAETRTALAGIYPDLRRLAPRSVEVRGGAIVAWGVSDIADPASELHERWRVGPSSRGGYHSVDTGKYSLAPLFAMEVADRILPG